MAVRDFYFCGTVLLNYNTRPTRKLSVPVAARRINGVSPSKQQQRPSVADVERAIGAGRFRDYDPTSSNGKGNTTFLELLQSNPILKEEGSTEKKIREAGEWLVQRTEGNGSRSGQEILMVVCLKILPVWIFSLLVASGVIKLPFSVPFLDDYLM